MRALRISVALFAALSFVAPLSAQGLEWVKAHYTKHEYYVPMRDGVRLFTAAYIPTDRSKTYPILLLRTPYGVAPYGPDQYKGDIGPSPHCPQEGFIFVYQDVRGRWMSEGKFEHVRPHNPAKRSARDTDESTDTSDTIDWLLKRLPENNGKVGMWGISYPGFYAAAGMIDAHPALKAVSPQAPVSDWFSSDDWHHNGALLLAHAVRWFPLNGWEFTQPTMAFPGRQIPRDTRDVYEFFRRLGPLANVNKQLFKGEIAFWNEMMKRDTRDDWWKARNIRPHLRNIKPAVMTVGGWFDAENLFGSLQVYRAVEAQSPGTQNVLVMGPWIHGGWARTEGDSLSSVRFNSKTSEFFRKEIELRFFNHFLKDQGSLDLPEALVFETGTNRWHKFIAWPPPAVVTKALYLHPNGKLAFDPPTATQSGTFDEYVSDPAKPVPHTSEIVSTMTREFMVADQRYAFRRPDVLAYQTEPLEEDVTLAGPIVTSLVVSTTGTDSDWIVKLIDVYPDRYPDEKGSTENTLGGTQQLVRWEVIRGKFRNGLERPEAFPPGEATKVEWTVPDVFHSFRRGHRIMIQIQSTWFPLLDLNPQKFLQINDATAADFQKATQRVYHSASMPSKLKLGILPGEQTAREK